MPKHKPEVRDKCTVCSKTAGYNWLSCEICDKWFQAKCVNIKKDAYKILQDLETSAHIKPFSAIYGVHNRNYS